jgi:hypothetical protein
MRRKSSSAAATKGSTMKRLSTFAAVLLLSAAPVFASGTSPSASAVNIQKAAADVATIATSLNTALNNPAIAAAIPGGLPAPVSAALADLVAVSQALATATSTTTAQTSVAQVEKDVNTVVNALSALPLPPPAPTILLAADVLLPVIEGAVGMIVPQTSSAPLNGMTSDAARMHLLTGK